MLHDKKQIFIPVHPGLYPLFSLGLLHNINGILIPHLKKVCRLTDTQSSFIDFALYLGYFVFALPAGIFLHRFGYKKGILCGLFLFAAGALLFLPAADARNYTLFLVALFVAASGATFLETVANPYAANMGSPKNSEQRLNFAQSFNGLGAVVAPLIGTHFILSGIEHIETELDAMQAAWGTIGLFATGGQLHQARVSDHSRCFDPGGDRFYFYQTAGDKRDGRGAWDGVLAAGAPSAACTVGGDRRILYVGAQVGVTSFLVRFSRYAANIGEKEAGNLLGLGNGRIYGGALPWYFFHEVYSTGPFAFPYAVINIGLLLVVLSAHGRIAVYALMTIPFFLSIMFPTIFALGIKDLGEETKLASAFLVMSIIGGAFTPVMMGLISDKTGGNIQVAYVMPVVSMAFILWFGLRGYKIKTLNLPSHEILSGFGPAARPRAHRGV